MLRLFCAAVVYAAALAGPANAAQFNVMIVTWRGCEEACQGFQDYLQEKGVDSAFILRDAARKKEALPAFLAEARGSGIDLLLTWGTSVSQGIAGTLDQLEDPAFNHDIPQVFMIVADPVGAGLVESLETSGRRNLTGTYNRVPERVNIEAIRAYLPSFGRLGLLYNANEENSVLKRDELAELAAAAGFELVALALPLGEDGRPRAEDIGPKVAELKAAGVDFINFGSSSFLQDNHEVFTNAAVQNGIPVLSPYERVVRDSKAVISVAPRYYDVGRLAGEQAAKILVDGIVPGDLPVLKMTAFAVVINIGVARELKLFPPLELLQVAETVE